MTLVGGLATVGLADLSTACSGDGGSPFLPATMQPTELLIEFLKSTSGASSLPHVCVTRLEID